MVEQSILIGPGVWLLFYGASLVLLAVAAVVSVRRSAGTGRQLLKWGLTLGLALVAARAAGGLDQWCPGLSENALATLRATIVVVVGSLATWILSSAILSSAILSSALVHRPAAGRARLAVFLVVEGAWLLAMSSQRVERFVNPTEVNDAFNTMCELSADHLTEVGDVQLKTSAGRPILVYRVDRSWQEAISSTSLTRDRQVGLSYSAIWQAPPDFRANCHGWVFADGRYIIRGKDVDKILSDNRYLRVARPQSGDVVVYRSKADNKVLHTGVVRFVDQGLVLIESKWGVWGRYLHQPEHQPYSNRFAFYRAPRPGHQLAEARKTPAVVRQPELRHAVRKKRIQLSCIMSLTSLWL